MNTEQDDAADDLWSALLPLMQAGEPDVYQRKVKALEIIRTALARRSSDEQAEVVEVPDIKFVIADYLELRDEALGFVSTDDERSKSAIELHDAIQTIHAKLSPPAVAAGGVTEAELVALAGKTYDDVLSGKLPHINPFQAVVEAITAALAVGDEGIREGWQPVTDDVRGPVTVCRFGDADHGWLPMTAYRVSGGKWERPASRDGLPYDPTHWQPLPTPPSRGEGE